jgi:hypothetical protein
MTTEQWTDLLAQWRAGNDNGEGFAVPTLADQTPLVDWRTTAEAVQDAGWDLLGLEAGGMCLAQLPDVTIALVCDAHGPWAVRVSPRA